MSVLKDCLSWQTTKLSYKCRTSYYSNNSLCLHFPFVLSLPVLSFPKGQSTLLVKREVHPPPPNPFVLNLSKHASGNAQRPTGEPFVLSLPVLSLSKGRSTRVAVAERSPC